ncbi:hypothetical protein [uncultured Winogradskyella sp.]|uniref:hypothetical protein n=1 Tax=uncultured Winogradskyella sp. TaxID=395353 RepID=UPI0030EF3A74|tara:strand:+ start:3520 stop:4860 length:1341 start_codon:yes stop_codon:yes gene_type:complete
MKSFFILIIFGVLNFISWNIYGSFFILNISLIFYFLEVQKDKSIYVKSLLCFVLLLIFNLTSVFWLFKVDGYKSIMIFIANSLLYLPIYIVYFLLNSKLKSLWFIVFYISFDIIYSLWDLAFPWLNFGNVFGNQWYLVNWYSITGTYGGSLWLLIMGWCFYNIITNRSRRTFIVFFSLGLFLPIFSLFQYLTNSYETTENEIINVIAYNPIEKSSTYNSTKEMYSVIRSIPNIDFVVTHELFYRGLHPSQLKQGVYVNYFDFYHQINPNTKFVIGTELFNNREIRFNGVAAVLNKQTLFRTKKKYVPITEYTPFLLRGWFSNYYQKNNKDDESKIIKSLEVFPLVCYESIFSSFVARKSLNANALFLLTSERFMNGSDFGKTQYLNIVRLRAIENNKSILKVSDDGISCLILPNGEIESYLTDEVEQIELQLFKSQSMYSKLINSL